ncbi:hypothetical protein F5888DRAFT_1724104 [Russula emetica]|nr:hypothetical protein F5888DRAFT_1724104 [Russula emetica]
MAHHAHYDTYREQLAGLYHGYALWQPAPGGLYDQVRVGDVGFILHGHFTRFFNALLPANHPAQGYDLPHDFEPLNMGHFGNIRTLNLPHGDYCSPTVTQTRDTIGEQIQAATPDEVPNASFRCRRGKGAFLSIPFNAHREDAIRTKVFETYIRTHCDSWLELAILGGFDVKLEDIIFVTGCDLTSSWAMATFMNPPWDADMSLSVQPVGPASAPSARFQWAAPSQPHNNEPTQNSFSTHCVFIRGFRAKRILSFYKKMKAFAENLPDDPDNEPDSSIELVREPDVPEYRDPLIGVLDYIAEQAPNQELAIAHEDDLKLIEGLDALTADAVENFLRQNEIPVLVDKGVALLGDEDEEVVPEEEKLTFLAQANVGGEPLPLIIHPVLTKYLLKFDITQPVEHDYELPPEELGSSAVHPPVHVLVLDNDQGYPRNINVRASEEGSDVGITVEDVTRTISADLRASSSQREWSALNEDRRMEVEETFENRARTEEDRSGGLRKIDYLRGRNRLQIFPKLPLPEDDEIMQSLHSARAV